MKKFWFVPLSVLVACQSMEDPVSQVQVVQQPTPGYQSSVLPSFEVLSGLAAECEGRIAQVYAGRGAVPTHHKKGFSIALGNSSKACQRLQQALTTLRETAVYQSEYEQNLAYAQGLVGSVEGGSSLGMAADFPEAGGDHAAQGAAIIPPSTIAAEPLAPTPLQGN